MDTLRLRHQQSDVTEHVLTTKHNYDKSPPAAALSKQEDV